MRDSLGRMDKLSAARYAIIEFGSEDYYGLYDAIPDLPNTPVEERIAVAREALRALVQEGLVVLCVGTWEANAFTVIPPEGVDSVLDDPTSWKVSDELGGPVYVFTNTERGDAAYQAGDAH
jgi:hypothetical protein